MAFYNSFSAPFRAPVASSAAVVPWWTGWTEAHDAKGAASYLASLLDITGGGNNASTGVAPSWAAGSGWAFNGATQYIVTPFIPSTVAASMIVKISAITVATDTYSPIGSARLDGNAAYLIQQTSGNRRFYNGLTANFYSTAGPFVSATYAIAGKTAYINGLPIGAIPAGAFSATALAAYIGALNVSATPAQFVNCTVTSAAFAQATRTDAEILYTHNNMP